VYANTSSEDGKKENQSVHTHCISENFQSGSRHEKRIESALEIGYQHFKRSSNCSLFMVK